MIKRVLNAPLSFCYNYLSVSFPTQLYLLLFCVFIGDSNFCFFSNFSFFHETHTLALNHIAELGDIFQSAPTQLRDAFRLKVLDLSLNLVFEYEKIKAHKVCILWSLLTLPIIPYDKMCMIIKVIIFSMIHNCPTSCYLIST